MELLIQYIQSVAEQDARCDNEEFNAYDWSGGNFDDAYEMGTQDGEIMLARRILKKFQS